MNRTRGTITNVVYEGDMEKLLERLGILEEVQNRKVRCMVCNRTISNTNVGILHKTGANKVEIVCDSLECIESWGGKHGGI